MRVILYICLYLISLCSYSQAKKQLLDVRVIPVHADWTYNENEDVEFTVTVLKDGHPVKGLDLSYQFGYERMDPVKKGVLQIKDKPVVLKCGKYSKPGFITCEASVQYNGKTYKGRGNTAIDPDKIKPTCALPSDFNTYWNEQIQKARKIALDTKMIYVPQKSTSKYEFYYINFQNNKVGSRIYGVLTIPKGSGTFPAILNVPGAGVRSYQGDGYLSDDGFISLTIGIHGIPVNLEEEVYQSLFKGAIDKYWVQNMDSKDDYYYNRVYLGCVRAVDFIFTLPQFNGKDLAVSGGSQGGALAIVTGALDERVSCITSFYPALSDLTGFLYGQAGGWPQLFKQEDDKARLNEKVKVLSYYDVVNFAKHLKVPGFYSWGYNDDVCPPTSVYAVYNSVNAPKENAIFYETEHWNYPEQWEEKQKFIKRIFKAE